VTDTHPQIPILVVGDVMVDTVVALGATLAWGEDQNSTISRRLGGQGSNTAAWLAWAGAPAVLLASCGDDPEAQWALDRLKDLGVSVHVDRMDRPTGKCVVLVDTDGARTMISDPGANVRTRSATRRTLHSILATSPIAHVHLSGYLLDRDPDLVSDIVQEIKVQGFNDNGVTFTVSLDASALQATESHRAAVAAILPHMNVLLGTSQELAELLPPVPGVRDTTDDGAIGDVTPLETPDIVRRWREVVGFRGVVVVKEGSAGASADAGTGLHRTGAHVSSVIDTTGAGDAFAAGFLAAWTLDPQNLDAALASGVDVATVAIGMVGGSPPLREGR
jgi:ribokinase